MHVALPARLARSRLSISLPHRVPSWLSREAGQDSAPPPTTHLEAVDADRAGRRDATCAAPAMQKNKHMLWLHLPAPTTLGTQRRAAQVKVCLGRRLDRVSRTRAAWCAAAPHAAAPVRDGACRPHKGAGRAGAALLRLLQILLPAPTPAQRAQLPLRCLQGTARACGSGLLMARKCAAAVCAALWPSQAPRRGGQHSLPECQVGEPSPRPHRALGKPALTRSQLPMPWRTQLRCLVPHLHCAPQRHRGPRHARPLRRAGRPR